MIHILALWNFNLGQVIKKKYAPGNNGTFIFLSALQASLSLWSRRSRYESNIEQPVSA